MILADKLINERKKNGWSQEELAEMLGVSRQSVSKWESAQSTPDLTRIIKMSELFGVSTDYLLKDDEEFEGSVELKEEVKRDTDIVSVSMEMASKFLKVEEKVAPRIANATSLCILSPAVLILLGGLTESRKIPFSEDAGGGIGLVTMMVMIAVAVYSFIRCGMETKEFEFLEKKAIETAYGVEGMVKERKKAFSKKFTTVLATGVVVCILSVVPLFVATIWDIEWTLIAAVSILLVIVAIGVNMIIRVSIIRGSYEKLLQDGDYTKEGKKASKVVGIISGIYWPLMVVIYLAWSFLTYDWEITWIVWPCAGILFGIISSIVHAIYKSEN